MSTNYIEAIIESDIESKKTEQVQTRFPPEPNGYLHIGHAKSLCINFGMADKYNGTCYLRYDDTNPSKEGEEFVKSIEEDIAWLGFKWKEIRFASSYFDITYALALDLIDKGLAYVCDYSAEQIKQTRGNLTEAGQNSIFRSRSVEENRQLFIDMKNGKFADGEKSLRAKIDMASPNLNMRDPIIYRILRATHHNTGDKWCIYPMYDFAHPIEDAVEGTTHSLCTLEFEDHRPLYNWVIENCTHKYFKSIPQQIEFARLNLTDTIMSKRFLKALVDNKKVMGWDDPRLPTLCGIRRKGFPSQAIKDFCNRIGVSKANSEVEWGYLESCVREHLNTSCDRVMAVANPVKVTIIDCQDELLDIENNPNEQVQTYRKVSFGSQIYIDGADFALVPPPKYYRLKPDGYVRLKGAYIIHCDSYKLDKEGNVIEVICSKVPNSKSGQDTSGVKVKGVIQWVDATNCLTATVRHFGKLLREGSEELPLLERLSDNSLTENEILVENSLKNSKVGQSYQFIRNGYYCLDKDACKDKLIFNEIVPLKDNFNK
ncbi:MAG: glutamine--tRNA ligase/YqeY domain fusion protein [Clostridia bacterium]